MLVSINELQNLSRSRTTHVRWKYRKEVASDLKTIYQAATVQEAEMSIEAFSNKWDAQLSTISRS